MAKWLSKTPPPAAATTGTPEVTPAIVEDLSVHAYAEPKILDLKHDERAMPNLVMAFKGAEDVNISLGEIAKWVIAIRVGFVKKAETTIARMEAKFNELKALVNIDPADSFVDAIRATLAEKAAAYCATRDEHEQAKRKLRRMNIELLGTPEREIDLKAVTAVYWLVTLYAAIGLGMEYQLNLGVLQGATSRITSSVISLIMGLATIAAVVIASTKRQEKELQKNAVLEHQRYYKNKAGQRDQVLNEKVEVAPLSAGHRFRYVASHLVAFGVPILMIVMRGFVIARQPNPNWGGGLAGSVAFLVATIIMYLIKINLRAFPENDRLDDYKEVKATIARTAKELTALQNPVSEEGKHGSAIKESWKEYNRTMDNLAHDSEKGGMANLQKVATKLISQVHEARMEFVHIFVLLAKEFRTSVGKTYTGPFELPADPATVHPGLVKPAFNITALDAIQNFIPTKFERMKSWHDKAREIWQEVLPAHEAELRKQREAEALRAADDRQLAAIAERGAYVPKVEE